MDTQNKQILHHLRTKGPITAIEALMNYNCFRLAARIHDLKEAGHVIHSDNTQVESGKYIARYSLIKEAKHDVAKTS